MTEARCASAVPRGERGRRLGEAKAKAILDVPHSRHGVLTRGCISCGSREAPSHEPPPSREQDCRPLPAPTRALERCLRTWCDAEAPRAPIANGWLLGDPTGLRYRNFKSSSSLTTGWLLFGLLLKKKQQQKNHRHTHKLPEVFFRPPPSNCLSVCICLMLFCCAAAPCIVVATTRYSQILAEP